MAMTYRANAFNSTPFSSCCGIASSDGNGRPDIKCHGCGEPLTGDYDGLSALRAKTPKGHCLMCGKHRSHCYC